MSKSEQINELATALAKAQAKIEGAVKDKSNPAFRSKYADLGACWDAIRGPLTENGLSVVQFPRTLEGAVEVETILLHSSGQFMSDVFAIPVSKGDAHGYMSATTYARRGALMAVAGIAPVDDDGNGAVGGNGKDAPLPAKSAPDHTRPPVTAPARNGSAKPTAVSASTNDEAAETFTTQSIETIGKMKHQEELAAWWRNNSRHIERLGARYPTLLDRLTVAADEMRDRLPHVTEAA